MNESTEQINEFLTSLSLDPGYRNDALNLLEAGESRYIRDLKVNFKSIMTSDHLSVKEIGLLALATAVNNNNQPLTRYFTTFLKEQGISDAEIAEAAACASLLASNNVFYRFRHFTQKEKYTQIPARIRMQIMMRPVNGKETFELLSLAISAVNGCEMCVNAHEDSLIKLGISEEKIFDSIRIASLVTSTGKIIF